MNSKPVLIGVTGGIGSGKSVICKIFNALGVPSYDADIRAKRLMNKSSVLKKNIIEAFGKEVYGPSGDLDRVVLASKVFGDKERLEQLNGLVHPEIALDFKGWVHQNRAASMLVKEAALLVESGSYKQLDFLICVTAPRQTRVNRVDNRDAFRSTEQINEIISSQLADEERIKFSDFVIKNSDNEMIVPQILKTFEAIKKASY